MNKIFRHKILAGAMLLGFMLAGSSCEDNVGINVSPEIPHADKTLYEVILDDPELTDFVEIINACGAHCADSLFNQSRVYTVWAPVNGTFNKDSIIAETVADSTGNSNRDIVFRTFVEAHIANHLVQANGTLDSDNYVLLLNNKNALFTGDYKSGYTFSGIQLDPDYTNVRVKNGLLHKIVSPSEYRYSIWEYMKIAKGEDWSVDSVSKYLYYYNVTEFNKGQSLKGPVVNGEQTYLDSVFTTSNMWLDSWNGVGLLNSEDSTYTVYVPTDEMWEKMVTKAEAHFNYNLSLVDIYKAIKVDPDSLRRYYARLHNLKYMTYSDIEQRYVESSDSAMPAYRGGKRVLFAKADIEKNVVFEKELSNGTFKVVSAMPYLQTHLWHDTIFLEGENSAMWYEKTSEKKENGELGVAYANKTNINKVDSTLHGAEISGGAYFNFPKDAGADNAIFKIPKVLSAKYQVAVVFVPKNITNEFADTTKMYRGKYLIHVKQGDKKIFTTARTKAFFTNKYGVDTVFLTNDGSRDGARTVIEFPYCEFYNGSTEKDYNVSVEIASVAATNDEKKKGINYDTSIRVDKIILIPVLDSEE